MSHQNSFGRKFHTQFDRAKDKIHLSKKDGDKKAGTMTNFTQLKQQKQDITKLADLWKKYLSKENEVSGFMTQFDKVLINSVVVDETLKEKSERIVAESDRTFPKNIEARIGTNLNVLKVPLDEIIKKSKIAEKCQQEVEASKISYEKATGVKKEQKKTALKTAENKFKKISDDLDKDVPKVIHDTDEKFYQFLTEYLDLKIEYFKKTLNDVEDIKRNMLLARSKYAGSSPTTQAALNDLQNVDAHKNSGLNNYKTSGDEYDVPKGTTPSFESSSNGKLEHHSEDYNSTTSSRSEHISEDENETSTSVDSTRNIHP